MICLKVCKCGMSCAQPALQHLDLSGHADSMCWHVGGTRPAGATAVAQRNRVGLLPPALRGALPEAPAEAGHCLASRQAARRP